jgi:hypothetical protein
MQLAWGMDEGAADILETLGLVGEHLELGEVFTRLELGGREVHTTFRLASMVCYYGQVGGVFLVWRLGCAR